MCVTLEGVHFKFSLAGGAAAKAERRGGCLTLTVRMTGIYDKAL
jgi:hypothetical protein